jgi:hypothetical protein
MGEKGMDAAVAEKAAADKRTADCQQTLKTDWGEKHGTYSKEIGQLVLDTVGDDGLKALEAEGYGNSVTLMKMLAAFTDMRAEPGSHPGGEGGRGDNARGLTKHQAVTAIAQLRADPKKAEALNDKNHVAHAATFAELQELRKIAYPGQVEK